jgi:hypothetical protein
MISDGARTQRRHPTDPSLALRKWRLTDHAARTCENGLVGRGSVRDQTGRLRLANTVRYVSQGGWARRASLTGGSAPTAHDATEVVTTY